MTFLTWVVLFHAVRWFGRAVLGLGLVWLGLDLWHVGRLFWHPLTFWLVPLALQEALRQTLTFSHVLEIDAGVILAAWVGIRGWLGLPIPDRALLAWSADAKVHPITGRAMARALRWYGKMTVRLAIDIERDTRHERRHVQQAQRHPGALALLKRFPLADSQHDVL